MPELPEVETSRRGIEPHLIRHKISQVIVRQPKLRWPIPDLQHLQGQMIRKVERRGKYLLIDCGTGTLIIHLGMSGSLRVLPSETPPEKHDHFDLQLGRQCLRLRDPRRFGAVLWTTDDPLKHPRICTLGPEPLSEKFNIEYLWKKAKSRKVAIKSLIMDGKVVVGVGNIYATESLFLAGIHPNRPCNGIAKKRLYLLVDEIKKILAVAIEKGGTTLKDFQQQDGKPGYFQQELLIYGRQGEVCPKCTQPIQILQIGQRSSTYCKHCQR